MNYEILQKHFDESPPTSAINACYITYPPCGIAVLADVTAKDVILGGRICF